MIIRFSCENFRSYKSLNTLDFVSSTKITKLPDHEKRFGRLSVVKNLGIFGSNAFGKSNILNAIGAMVNLIVKGRCSENISFIDDKTKPSKFNMVFVTDEGHFYEYSFSVKKDNILNPLTILDEELYQVFLNGKSQLIYSKKDGLQSIDDEALKYFADGYKNISGQLFLKYINAPERFVLNSKLSTVLRQIYTFFSSNIVVQFDANGLMYTISKESIDEAKNYLKKYDIGLEDVDFVEISENEKSRIVNDPIFRIIQNEFQSKPKLKAQYFNDTRDIYCIEREKTNYLFKKLSFKHKGIDSPFSFGYESKGTQRIFSLLTLLMNKQLNKNRTIIIDEIEKSTFPDISCELVKDFQNEFKDCNTQIVFTTHQTSFLNSVLRRDEIYFVDKDSKGVSHLYPLTDFKADSRENIVKHFNEGAYGALPRIEVRI